mgnify:CR=1 FL=1
MQKFKKGQRVRVVKNTSDHGFKIGIDVKITLCFKDSQNDYFCRNGTASWFVRDEDIEAIAEPIPFCKSSHNFKKK